MKASSHAPYYDLFKLIVAIVLLIIFLLLMWKQPGGSSQPITIILTSTPPPLTPTVATAPPTTVPPTATPVPKGTSLPTSTHTQTSTPVPTPTALATEEPLPTPIVEIPTETAACEAISRSQLQVGMKATIQRRLNFRSSPGLFDNWILTNNPGTPVEIVDGPACTRYQNGGAYLWWQIKLPNGLVGWSAEASAYGTFYFMEPAK